MKRGLLLVIALGGCGQKAAQPSPSSVQGGAGSGGTETATGGAIVASVGGVLTAAGAGAGATQAEAGQSALSPDDYDDSGCTHPSVVTDCADGFCKIPPGCFIMGSPEAEWHHAPQEQRVKVTLTSGFSIADHEVTQAEWLAVGLSNPSKTPTGKGDCLQPECPVGNVNWFEAVSYANLLSEKEGLSPCYQLRDCVGAVGQDPSGLVCLNFELSPPSIYECKGYRLPTDPEWEYAARAGSRGAYYVGDITTRADVGACVEEPGLGALAWYCINSGTTTHPARQLKPNQWGLYDMLGNAMEWAHDQSGWVPQSERLTDPDQSYGPGQGRDTRGGGYFAWPGALRAASRVGLSASFRSPGIGFRLVRTLP